MTRPEGAACRGAGKLVAVALLAMFAVPGSWAEKMPSDDLSRRLLELRRREVGRHAPLPEAESAELAAIGRVYLLRGDEARAIELLEESVARNPGSDAALGWLILAYVRHGDFEFGRSYLEIATSRELAAAPEPAVYREIGERFSAANFLDAAAVAWGLYRRAGGDDALLLARLDRTRRELAASPGQRSIANDAFTIYGDEAISADELARIERDLAAEYERQTSLFGSGLGKPPVVVLHAGRRYFSLVSIPDWVSGVFDGKIRISLDAARGFGPEVATVLSHELAHAFIREISGGRAPGWLHEGLAQWCSGRRIPRAEFRRELAGVRPRTIDEMEGALVVSFDPGPARAQYAESLGLVEYLAARRGEGAVFCLVRDLGAGEDLARALRRECGLSTEQLVAGWRAWAGI
ncbi:MAG: hypothetical protein M3167_16045 [Acidobacteriota bacterium]|nr:hypothetical protein [Acidobacteriota bacterium]